MIVKIFDYLEENDIEVYFVGQKTGTCTSNYVVVKDAGTLGYDGGNKVGNQLIDLLFFVPQNCYTEMEEFKNNIKELMKDFNEVRYTGQETPIITDDDYKALSCSVMYQNQKLL